MRILIAEDNPQVRHMLERTVAKWGYEAIIAKDGNEAWQVLQQENSPQLAILDWMMPGIDGITICRKVRETDDIPPVYLLILTAKGDKEDIVSGLRAGADDYVTKPFSLEELEARLRVGVRMIQLQSTLREQIKELKDSLAHVKQLQGLLPICSYCKKICDDKKYWNEIELYIAEHSDAEFSHVVCPECNEKILKPELERLKKPNE